jgi:predicted metal-dependent peptidase
MSIKDLDKVRIAVCEMEPLLATVLCRLKTVAVSDPSIISYTDGSEIVIGKETWEGLELRTKCGVMLHELLHVIFQHPWYMKEVVPDKHELFNIVADIVINKTLLQHSYKIPEGGFVEFRQLPNCGDLDKEDIRDHTVMWFFEEVLKRLPQGGCGPKWRGKDRKCCRPAKDDRNKNIKDELKGLKLPDVGRMGGDLLTMLGVLEKTQTNWKVILRKWLEIRSDDVWLFCKGKQQERIIRPRLVEYDTSKADLVMIIDSSGSIDDKTLYQFGCEVYSVLKSCGRKIHLIVTDAKVQQSVLVEDVNQIPKGFKGRGGTVFIEAFQEVKKRLKVLEDPIVVVLTDGNIADIEKCERPVAPVIWVIINNPEFKQPFGDVVHICYK